MSSASLEAVLHPATVAVIGASRSRASVGGEIFANLVGRPFSGAVYPVHATATHVQGVRAYKTIADVPDPVDLAIVAVPAAEVHRVMRACAETEVRAAVLITAGFGESGADGARAQAAILATATQAGMRVVGPNCLGVVNTDPDVALHATFATGWPPRGNVSIASQSGALGIALLDEARDHGIGIRHFVSLGNEADVSAEDLLEHWEHDAETRVILLYLESFRDPRRFLEVARRVSRTKPIVAVKSGRSLAGARAAGSHTGAIATRDAVVDALLAQAGVVRVATLEELFDAATLFAAGHAPAGRRVAIVTNAGGPGILAADACEAHGLSVPAFADGTVRAIGKAVPEASARNPLDLLAGAKPQAFDDVLACVLGDAGVDALVVTCVPTTSADVRDIARGIVKAQSDAGKPIVACVMGKRGVDEARAILQKARIPAYSLPESAAAALAAAATHAEAARRTDVASTLPRVDVTAGRARIATDARNGGRDGDRWLRPDETTTLLDTYGLRCLPSIVARDAEAAAYAASVLGYPVVLKIVSRAVQHKTDLGGVLLDVRDAAGVREGMTTLERRMIAVGRRADLDGVLVQTTAPRGVEMFVGATRDATFGPVIAFGTGGVQLGLWNDVALRLAPVTGDESHRMLDAVRGKALLDGFRGAPPADREALAAAIQRISRLMEDLPEVLELDLNPLLALEAGRGVVVVDARIRIGVPR
jgi:acetyl coenzyme A synthetase (ADP forming)-like protein